MSVPPVAMAVQPVMMWDKDSLPGKKKGKRWRQNGMTGIRFTASSCSSTLDAWEIKEFWPRERFLIVVHAPDFIGDSSPISGDVSVPFVSKI